MDNFKVTCLVVISVLILSFAARNTWGLRFLDDIQQNAPQFLKENGFEVIGCQGYQTDLFHGTAFVWFTVERENLIYECAVMKRHGDYQLYGLEVKNAVNISVK